MTRPGIEPRTPRRLATLILIANFVYFIKYFTIFLAINKSGSNLLIQNVLIGYQIQIDKNIFQLTCGKLV